MPYCLPRLGFSLSLSVSVLCLSIWSLVSLSGLSLSLSGLSLTCLCHMDQYTMACVFQRSPIPAPGVQFISNHMPFPTLIPL